MIQRDTQETVDIVNTVTGTSSTLRDVETATTLPGSSSPATNAYAPLRLPGRYEDLGEIAGGSFGEVRRVLDTLLDRIVAMKLMRAQHAHDEPLRQRFLTEVRITGQLQHPGIVAVHDRGELDDGRLWFTMKEIRGRTLGQVIDELHAAATPDGFVQTSSGWTFRRVVDAFARIVQAVAYAHSRGIVHRDLKPDNMMVGEFGEVLVMDWGLARRVGSQENDSRDSFQNERAANLTQHGDILGTPAFMSPEQARGALALHGPASDVFALGAVLYCLLAGHPPYTGSSSREVLTASLLGPPPSLRSAARIAPPNELLAICERAMQRQIADRYPDAAAMSEDLVAWLDGVRLREQALEALQQTRAHEPEIKHLRIEAHEKKSRARAIRNDLRANDPIEKKIPAWSLEDEANGLRRLAALAETKWLEAVHGSLSVDPGLPEAHALLADHYRERLVEAERENRDEDAARAEALLRIHDRGKHAAFLRGDGRLTLVTNPPGADVFVDRYVLQNRRLVAIPEGSLGQTPLVEVKLPRGSYLLRIRAPGRTEVRYPVLIERDEHWHGVPPGKNEPFHIYLPNEGELGMNDIYVPGGYCWTGGDENAPDSLPRKNIWIPGFVIGRHPVTNEAYLAFLNDLVIAGREDEALRACPRANPGTQATHDALAYERTRDGLFQLKENDPGQSWHLQGPAVLMDWDGAVAYASWLAVRKGKPWRLVHELEREKATRGVDGRYFPWGNHFDATFACMLASHEGDPGRVPVGTYTLDEAPCGMQDGAGNVRDFCANLWTLEGPVIREGLVDLEVATLDDSRYRSVRGGAWSSVENHCRAAGRFVLRPGQRRSAIGLRVGRTLQ